MRIAPSDLELFMEVAVMSDLTSSRAGNKSDRDKRDAPKTVTEKIAFLLEEEPEPEDSSSRRRKPRTVVGTVAFMCGTKKSVVRDWTKAMIIVGLIVGAAYAIQRTRSDATTTDMWQGVDSSSSDNKMLKMYGENAQRAFSGLSDERKDQVRSTMRKKLASDDALRSRADTVYKGLSEEKKKEVRKMLGQ